MEAIDTALQIQFEDGRVIVARPRPEDQDLLRDIGRDVKLELGSSDFDTAGHGVSDELTIDVEGHAMTLRLPTPADAEALRRMLVFGAMAATIVVAGAAPWAFPQSAGSPAAVVVQPGPGPAAAEDFAARREQAIDKMLEAPVISGQPSDVEFERLDRISAPTQAGQAAPRADFQTRKEQATDKLLETPPGEAPAAAPDQGGSHRVGGPQD